VGSGKSDLSAYDAVTYGSLRGYADDVVEICRALDLHDVVFVGHSVASMIGALASLQAPDLFGALVMVGPSPRYVDDGDYVGGFTRSDIAGLLDALDGNHLGWSAQMAPVIMGNPDRPELAAELTNSFCATDPEIARQFARVTFLSDNRADLAAITVPTLVLQCSDDPIAPEAVGTYVHEHIAGSVLTHLKATGHCPNLSAPVETTSAIRAFLQG
jgi:sigma-B regulation protein RsbQ